MIKMSFTSTQVTLRCFWQTDTARGMRYGAIPKINSVILEFVRKEDISKNNTKRKNNAIKLKMNVILVKFMFNLECGNTKKGIVKDI